MCTVLYSEWKKVPAPIRSEAWRLLQRSVKQASSDILNLLREMEQSNGTQRSVLNQHRNAIKMTCYLVGEMIEMVEADFEELDKTHAITNIGKRGKKKSSVGGNSLDLDWLEEYHSLFSSLDCLFQLNICKLWEPPVLEGNFVNTLGNCCYKTMERKCLTSNTTLRNSVCRLLMTLVKRYGHTTALCVELTQLLKRNQHMVTFLTELVSRFSEDGNMVFTVRELLKEICSFAGEDLEKDSTALSNFSGFLQQVASGQVELANSMLPLLHHFLETDPYQMRICAVIVMGHVLKGFCDTDSLNPKDMLRREKLMDKLQDHISDVNSFVRARALQTWHDIVVSKTLSIGRQCDLAELLVGPTGALHDVSCLARKFALKAITSMVLMNPSSKLSSAELNKVLQMEEQRLESLQKTLFAAEDVELQEGMKKGQAAEKPEEGEEEQASREFTAGQRVTDSDSGNSSDSSENEEKSESENEGDRHKRRLERRKRIQNERDTKEGCAQATKAIQDAEMGQLSEAVTDENALPSHTINLAKGEIQLNLARQNACVRYLRLMHRFVQLVGKAVNDIKGMLTSKTATDVMEGIEFFMVAKEAGVSGVNEGLTTMLSLIWSSEESVRKAVVDCCCKLYIHPENASELAGDQLHEIVLNNIIELVEGCTNGELWSLERIIKELSNMNELHSNLIEHVWGTFERSMNHMLNENVPNKKLIRRINCILVTLAMLCKPSEAEFTKRIDMLVGVGLGANFSKLSEAGVPSLPAIDLENATYVCKLIQKLAPMPINRLATEPAAPEKKGKSTGKATKTAAPAVGKPAETPMRLRGNHQLFSWLKTLITATVTSPNRSSWIPFTQQAISTIYRLADIPDRCAAELLQQLAKKLDRANAPQGGPGSDPEESMDSGEMQTQPPTQQRIKIPSFQMARFVSVIGHVGLKQMVFLETDVLQELKRRAKKNNADSGRRSKTSGRKSVAAAPSVEEEEMGLVGATAEDTEQEFIRSICEDGLASNPRCMLFKLVQVVVAVCQNPARFTDTSLQSAAALSLAKLMLLSSHLCEKYVQLLFTIAEKNNCAIIRANLIVALGDLCRRYPNLMEPWTPNLYGRLRDSSARVRVNALNTLSHLILNDMVKVKGQISEMTVCLVDADERLAKLSRIFLRELGQKGNTLYNVLPDIISRLSDTEVGVSEADFQRIVDYLFEQIQKDRQCETLVEKLCARFSTSNEPLQWSNLAYCLKCMTYNDRMLNSLMNNISTYINKLHVEAVYNSFLAILQKVKNIEKPEIKQQVDDFESKIKEVHEKGVQDEEALQRAEVATREAAQKRVRRSRKSAAASPPNASASQPARKRLARSQPSPVESEAEDVTKVDETVDESFATTRSTRQRNRSRVSLPVFDSEPEEE